MRSRYNRQTRRAGRCIRARRPRGRRRVTSPGRIALTAHGPGLAEVAEWIGTEIELSDEIAELLSVDLRGADPLAPARHWSNGRMFDLGAEVLRQR